MGMFLAFFFFFVLGFFFSLSYLSRKIGKKQAFDKSVLGKEISLLLPLEIKSC